MIEKGEKLQDFTLTDDRGQAVRWADLRGKPVVLFAYPRADTPGCTKEACAFRDLQGDFASKGVAVYGISADKPAAQARFRDKYQLGIPLLSDPDRQILTILGAYGKKMMYGKEVQGIIRSTWAFDRDGAVAQVWRNVKVDGHADKVLAEIASLFPSQDPV